MGKNGNINNQKDHEKFDRPQNKYKTQAFRALGLRNPLLFIWRLF